MSFSPQRQGSNPFHDLAAITRRAGEVGLGNSLKEKNELVVRNLDKLCFGAEIITAAALCGSLPVEMIENKTHRSLNPFADKQTLSEDDIKKRTRHKKKTDGEESNHWLNKAGYLMYALSGPFKLVANNIRSFKDGNPTALFGMASLIPVYPLMAFNHGYWTKLAILFTFNFSDVGYGRQYKNELLRAQAAAKGESMEAVMDEDCSELREVLRWPAIKRLVQGKLETTDVKHWKAVGTFMVNDQKTAWANVKQMVKDIGIAGKELGKEGISHVKEFTKPEHLKALYKAKLPQVFTNPNEFYQMHQSGAMLTCIILAAQTVGRLSGAKKTTDTLAQVGLMVAGPLMYCSFIQRGRGFMNTPGKKLIGIAEIVAALGMLVGDVFWFMPWGFGAYRAGSSMKYFGNQEANQQQAMMSKLPKKRL